MSDQLRLKAYNILKEKLTDKIIDINVAIGSAQEVRNYELATMLMKDRGILIEELSQVCFIIQELATKIQDSTLYLQGIEQSKITQPDAESLKIFSDKYLAGMSDRKCKNHSCVNNNKVLLLCTESIDTYKVCEKKQLWGI